MARRACEELAGRACSTGRQARMLARQAGSLRNPHPHFNRCWPWVSYEVLKTHRPHFKHLFDWAMRRACRPCLLDRQAGKDACSTGRQLDEPPPPHFNRCFPWVAYEVLKNTCHHCEHLFEWWWVSLQWRCLDQIVSPLPCGLQEVLADLAAVVMRTSSPSHLGSGGHCG